MTRSPSPATTQRHSVAGIGGDAHLVAGPRQGLVEHGADRGIVVGDKNAAPEPSCWIVLQRLRQALPDIPFQAGISTRKMVSPGVANRIR